MTFRQFYVYMLTNKTNKVLYVGVTNNLVRRVCEHKQKINEGFTKRYNLTKLIYFEIAGDPICAIKREKQLKNWRRQWKIEMIEKENPDWKDLSEGWS